MNIVPHRSGFWMAWLFALATFAVPALAGEFKVNAQLAWGTDDTKPNNPSLRELDPKIREKFRHLRWKNYFVVKAETASVPQKDAKKINLSEKCVIDVRDKGDGHIEIRIYNVKPGSEPVLVKTEAVSIQKLKNGHLFVFAGDTKEKWDDAWLVIVTVGE